MSIRIDGTQHADAVKAEVAHGVAAMLATRGVRPMLAAVLVGGDPASAIYVRRKAEAAEVVGMRSLSIHRDADITQADLMTLIAELNADPAVNGILVQLPLPPHIDRHPVLAAIDPTKDVDGFHAVNVGRLALGEEALVPCTPAGCMILLDAHAGELRGRHAVVVGASHIVGRPMAQLLLQRGCTVSIAHADTVDLPGLVRQGDILVVATGVAGLVRGDWIKRGAVVIDVGISRVVDANTGKARIVGDVRFDEAARVAAAITPVPGGVGPMTIACLLRNTLVAASRQHGVELAAPSRRVAA